MILLHKNGFKPFLWTFAKFSTKYQNRLNMSSQQTQLSDNALDQAQSIPHLEALQRVTPDVDELVNDSPLFRQNTPQTNSQSTAKSADFDKAITKPFGQTLKGNVIYIVNLGGFPNALMEAVAKQANDYLKILQVPTRVGVARTKLSPQAFMQELAPNEGVAFIVKTSTSIVDQKTGLNTYPEVDSIAAYSTKFARILGAKNEEKTWSSNNDVPERSSNSVRLPGNYVHDYNAGKNCIAIKYSAVKSNQKIIGLTQSPRDVIKGMALYIIHGAGHNAQMFKAEQFDDPRFKKWNHYGGIMFSGSVLQEFIRSGKGNIKKLLNPNLRKGMNWNHPSGKPTYSYLWDSVNFNFPSLSADSKKHQVYDDPSRYPNLAYKYSMGDRFGTHKATANQALGYLPN